MFGTYCRLGVPKIQKVQIITPLVKLQKYLFLIKSASTFYVYVHHRRADLTSLIIKGRRKTGLKIYSESVTILF